MIYQYDSCNIYFLSTYSNKTLISIMHGRLCKNTKRFEVAPFLIVYSTEPDSLEFLYILATP